MAKQYVQHISGQGEKWMLVETADHRRSYCIVDDTGEQYRVPLSEYRFCDPPERWEDATEQCEYKAVGMQGPGLYDSCNDQLLDPTRFRLRKVRLWWTSPDGQALAPLTPYVAFIVEQKING